MTSVFREQKVAACASSSIYLVEREGDATNVPGNSKRRLDLAKQLQLQQHSIIFLI